MATFDQRGPKQWRARIRRKVNGKSFYLCKTFSSLKKAKSWAQIWEEKVVGVQDHIDGDTGYLKRKGGVMSYAAISHYPPEVVALAKSRAERDWGQGFWDHLAKTIGDNPIDIQAVFVSQKLEEYLNRAEQDLVDVARALSGTTSVMDDLPALLHRLGLGDVADELEGMREKLATPQTNATKRRQRTGKEPNEAAADSTLITVEEISEMTRMAPGTIRNILLQQPERLPVPIRLPGHRRILWKKEDVEAWLNNIEPSFQQAAASATQKRPRGRPPKPAQPS